MARKGTRRILRGSGRNLGGGLWHSSAGLAAEKGTVQSPIVLDWMYTLKSSALGVQAQCGSSTFGRTWPELGFQLPVTSRKINYP